MSLLLKKQRDGKRLRSCWYGSYTENNGERRVINLNVEWRGTPPQSLKVSDLGDTAFEKSRGRAQDELDRYVDESRRKGRADHLTERLIQSKTGKSTEYVSIEELPQKWRNVGRNSKPTDDYLAGCDARFRRFIKFMKRNNPAAKYLYEITQEDADAFRRSCLEELAPATAKNSITMLKGACDFFLPRGASNPFAVFAGRGSKTDGQHISRKPFTPEQLRMLLEKAREDEFMYPLITCAAMTGMRRSDVCTLRWEDVDLDSGMLSVKTRKTQKGIEIPIFLPLREVLDAAGGKQSGYVWPEAAKMLKENRGKLTYRFKKIIVQTFSSEELRSNVDDSEIEMQGIAAIKETYQKGPRRDRMISVLRKYLAGDGIRKIEKALGVDLFFSCLFWPVGEITVAEARTMAKLKCDFEIVYQMGPQADPVVETR